MNFIKSIFLAFSMFSTIPMPKTDWNEKNMRYMMSSFPLVGLLISILEGGLLFIFYYLTIVRELILSGQLFALVFLLIPVGITGGIHIDGFMDTSDALASHGNREKKLEILKDSHCGAFAILACIIYFLIYFVFSNLLFQNFMDKREKDLIDLTIVSLLLTFIQSRLYSAFAVSLFPIAKNSSLVKTFSGASAKRFTAIWSLSFIVITSFFSVYLSGIKGAFLFLTQLSFFIYYYFKSKKNFGGISGDTAGWFVQIFELISLCAFVLLTEVQNLG